MYRVILTGPARRDIQDIHDWWASHRSVQQAAQWYLGLYAAISTLVDMPLRCPLAPETDLLPQSIRQLLFGIGPRRTHRIIFTVHNKDVVVLRVRHMAQNELAIGQLPQL